MQCPGLHIKSIADTLTDVALHGRGLNTTDKSIILHYIRPKAKLITDHSVQKHTICFLVLLKYTPHVTNFQIKFIKYTNLTCHCMLQALPLSGAYCKCAVKP